MNTFDFPGKKIVIGALIFGALLILVNVLMPTPIMWLFWCGVSIIAASYIYMLIILFSLKGNEQVKSRIFYLLLLLVLLVGLSISIFMTSNAG